MFLFPLRYLATSHTSLAHKWHTACSCYGLWPIPGFQSLETVLGMAFTKCISWKPLAFLSRVMIIFLTLSTLKWLSLSPAKPVLKRDDNCRRCVLLLVLSPTSSPVRVHLDFHLSMELAAILHVQCRKIAGIPRCFTVES